ERAREPHPLPHPARQRRRALALRAAEPAHVDIALHEPVDVRPMPVRVRRSHREADVVEHGHPGHEREVLEHHHAIHAGLPDLSTFEDHAAGRSALETGDNVEQRALAASGVADHRDELALLDLEAHVAEDADLATALGRREELRHMIDLEIAHSVYASRRDRRLRPASSSTPITPIARTQNTPRCRARLSPSFHTK